MNPRLTSHAVTVAALGLLVACSGVYYSALEKVGIEKRDILVDRVESARDAQMQSAIAEANRFIATIQPDSNS